MDTEVSQKALESEQAVRNKQLPKEIKYFVGSESGLMVPQNNGLGQYSRKAVMDCLKKLNTI